MQLSTKLLLFLLSTLALPSRGQVLPLDSVLTRIELNNPMLKEFDAQAQAMDAYAEGATSWMPPQVGAGVFMAPYDRGMIREMNEPGMLGSAMISVEQMIPNPAKQRANRAFMSAQSAVERAGRSYAYNQLRAQAKELYYGLGVLEKKRNVLQENEKLIRLMIELGEIRYRYNQGEISNIYKAQARLHELENEQLMLQSEIRQRLIGLNTLMNRPEDQVFQVDTTLLNLEAAVIPADTAALSQTRSDIRRIDESARVLRLKQNLEASQRKPDFGVRFDHMISLANMPNQFTLMGMVSIPIVPWASRMYKANVRGINFEIQALQRQREAILNEATGMLQAMATDLTAKKKQVENYEARIIPALRRNYQTTLLAYEQNTGGLPIVIDAWEALNMAQMQYLDNLEELLKMQVAYERELEK